MAKDSFKQDFNKYLNSRLNKKEEKITKKKKKKKSKKFNKNSVENLFFEEVVMQENDVGIIKRGESKLRRYLKNNFRRKKEIEFIETHFSDDEIDLGHKRVEHSIKTNNLKDKLNLIFQKVKSKKENNLDYFQEVDNLNKKENQNVDSDSFEINSDYSQEFDSQKVPIKFKRKKPKSHVKVVDLETNNSIKLGVKKIRNVFINMYYHFANRPDRFDDDSLGEKVLSNESQIEIKNSFEDAKEILSHLATTISELNHKEKMNLINNKDFKYLLNLDDSINKFEEELEDFNLINEDKNSNQNIKYHKDNLEFLKNKIKAIKKLFKRKDKGSDFEINLEDFKDDIDIKKSKKNKKTKNKSKLSKDNKKNNKKMLKDKDKKEFLKKVLPEDNKSDNQNKKKDNTKSNKPSKKDKEKNKEKNKGKNKLEDSEKNKKKDKVKDKNKKNVVDKKVKNVKNSKINKGTNKKSTYTTKKTTPKKKAPSNKKQTINSKTKTDAKKKSDTSKNKNTKKSNSKKNEK